MRWSSWVEQGSGGRLRCGPAQQVLCRDSRQGPSDGKVSNRSMIEEECNLRKMIKVRDPLYLGPSRAIYRRIVEREYLKVCCDRSSCLTEFVILLGERADVASEVLDLEGCCFSRGKLGLTPSSGLTSVSRPARDAVRPCAQLGA